MSGFMSVFGWIPYTFEPLKTHFCLFIKLDFNCRPRGNTVLPMDSDFQHRKKESEVGQLCWTPCDPMDCSLLSSSVHGIFQARVPEWVAISFSRGSSRPRDSALQADALPSESPSYTCSYPVNRHLGLSSPCPFLSGPNSSFPGICLP